MDNGNNNEKEINDQFNRQFGFNPNPIPLPNSTASLVLGIVSAAFGLIWCYWVGSLIALVCGIIAINQSKRAKELYNESPQTFKPNSFGNANAGRILGIVGVCLASLWFLFLIIVVVIAAAAGSGNIFDF